LRPPPRALLKKLRSTTSYTEPGKWPATSHGKALADADVIRHGGRVELPGGAVVAAQVEVVERGVGDAGPKQCCGCGLARGGGSFIG
jgi:hypothetical protein